MIFRTEKEKSCKYNACFQICDTLLGNNNFCFPRGNNYSKMCKNKYENYGSWGKK